MRIKSLCAFLPDAAAPDSIPLLPEAVWNFLQALRRAAAVLQASDVCQGEISHLQSTESEQYPFSQVGWSCCCPPCSRAVLWRGWLSLWNERRLTCGNRKGFSEKLGGVGTLSFSSGGAGVPACPLVDTALCWHSQAGAASLSPAGAEAGAGEQRCSLRGAFPA